MYFILFWLYHLNNFPKLDIITKYFNGGRDRQIEEGRKKVLRAKKGLITYMYMYLNKGRDRQKEREGVLIVYLNNGRDRQIEERNSKREGV